MNRFQIITFPLANKTVFLRADLDLPLEGSQRWRVKDNQRLITALPTIKFLLSKNCKIILAGHLGRPAGRLVKSLSVKPVVKELTKLLQMYKITAYGKVAPNRTVAKVTYLPDCIGKEVKTAIAHGCLGEIFVLENLRFYREEEENDSAFAHSLADLAEVYINEAFASTHRQHASIQAITNYLPSLAGINVERELQELSKALNPLRPAVWILGGAKLDKISLLQKLLQEADYILIGGALAFPFLKAKGFPTGMSIVTENSVKLAKEWLTGKNSHKIILPLDFIAAEKMAPNAVTTIINYDRLQHHQLGLDLGPQTVQLFKQYLRKAKTIVWNGPLGYFEWSKFSKSTKDIGRFIGSLTAISICSGGDTARALRQFHLDHLMTHVSTGGGAALTFLEGKKLVGITALEENYLKFRNLVEVISTGDPKIRI